MKNAGLNTDLLDKAIIFAVNAHHGTERRGKAIPYIVHPMEAMEIVATMTNDQYLLAAAVLHDTVEDTDLTIGDIRREFGGKVADLVGFETDIRETTDGHFVEWKERKMIAIEKLNQAGREEKIVTLGDKLSNIRAIARDYCRQGESFWNLFHEKDKAVHAWRYKALAEAMKELADTEAYQEFDSLVKKVFG